MPELPDLTVYLEALAPRVLGQPVGRIAVLGPIVLRSAVPPIAAAEGRRVTGLRRLGKRIVLVLEGELFLVFHLMRAGRLRWVAPGARPPARITQALLAFPAGDLAFTEAGTKRRASLHLLAGETALAAHDPGGIELQQATPAGFAARLSQGNHTLKRALTDPRCVAGIGNAYSDEILHRARLSPLTLTSKLSAEELGRLHAACLTVLEEWTARLRAAAGDAFPEHVTAFRPGMAVHGRYGLPCPDCGAPVQRIVHADSEINYCARCQTGGRLLADRSLSRLLKKRWPKSVDDLD